MVRANIEASLVREGFAFGVYLLQALSLVAKRSAELGAFRGPEVCEST